MHRQPDISGNFGVVSIRRPVVPIGSRISLEISPSLETTTRRMHRQPVVPGNFGVVSI
jgi:hypothetical protein